MDTQEVILKVNQPTRWHAGMVIAIRTSVDLRCLNQNVLREVHPLLKIDNILVQISDTSIYSKLDANLGFIGVDSEF